MRIFHCPKADCSFTHESNTSIQKHVRHFHNPRVEMAMAAAAPEPVAIAAPFQAGQQFPEGAYPAGGVWQQYDDADAAPRPPV